jgi:hypothetical protein
MQNKGNLIEGGALIVTGSHEIDLISMGKSCPLHGKPWDGDPLLVFGKDKNPVCLLGERACPNYGWTRVEDGRVQTLCSLAGQAEPAGGKNLHLRVEIREAGKADPVQVIRRPLPDSFKDQIGSRVRGSGTKIYSYDIIAGSIELFVEYEDDAPPAAGKAGG